MLQGRSTDARTKEKPTFPVARRNPPTFKNYERLGYKQVFGHVEVLQSQPFQENGCANQRRRLCLQNTVLTHRRKMPQEVQAIPLFYNRSMHDCMQELAM